jgi:hypothetical protein
MKAIKILFSMLIMSLFFIAITFTSCTKEDETKATAEQINIVKTAPKPEMRTLYMAGPMVLGCAEPPANCLPTVIITPTQLKSTSNLDIAYNSFVDNFNNGKANEFFKSDDYLLLFPEVNSLPGVLNELRNSDIKLHHQKNKQDGFDYYIGLPKKVDFNSDWKGLEKCVFVVNYKK